jgi:purine nucleosidase
MIVTDMREHPFEAETVEFAVEVDEKKAIGELLAAFWEK